jgi:hypothetical protein
MALGGKALFGIGIIFMLAFSSPAGAQAVQAPQQGAQVQSQVDAKGKLEAVQKDEHPGNGTGPAVSGPLQLQAHPADQVVQRNTDQHGEKAEWWDAAVRFFGGFRLVDTLTLLLTTIIAVANYGMWRANVRLVRDAKDTAKTELRAWIFVKSATLNMEQRLPQAWHLDLVFENYGATPASSVVIETHLELRAVEDPAYILLAEETVTTRLGGFAPKSIILHRDPAKELGRGTTTWNALRNTDQAFYLAGAISYVDAFGARHRTTFQMMCEPSNVTSFGHSEVGNEYD